MTQETINQIIKFRDDREWKQFHNPKDLAISISLEASELLEVFQWSGADTSSNADTGGRAYYAGGDSRISDLSRAER